MARGQALTQVNNFTGGLITEASPLSFPQNSLSKALNVVINQDGSIEKRLPFNDSVIFGNESDKITTALEAGCQLRRVSRHDWTDRDAVVLTFQFIVPPGTSGNSYTVNAFRTIHCVYTIDEDGHFSYVKDFFGIADQPYEPDSDFRQPALEASYPVTTSEQYLFMPGLSNVDVYNIDTDETTTDGDLIYRDFKSIPNYKDFSSEDEFDDDERPATAEITNFHLYNLFNNGWRDQSQTVVSDEDATSITTAIPYEYVSTQLGYYPSLRDSFIESVVTDSTTAKTIGVFSPYVMRKDVNRYYRKVFNGSLFVRLGMEDSYRYSFDGFDNTLGDATDYLAYESSDYKPAVTAASAINGRLWYGVTDRDFNVMFSQVSDTFEEEYYSKCYQEEDPNQEDSQIIDTDGGVISLKNSGIVYKIHELGNYIVVVAENGVWAISSTDGPFKPTDVSIERVLNTKMLNQESSLSTPNGVFAAGEGGFYILYLNDYGNISVTNLSNTKIKKLYKSIAENLETCGKVSTLYNAKENLVYLYYTVGQTDLEDSLRFRSKALVYNIDMQCFYEYEVGDQAELVDEDYLGLPRLSLVPAYNRRCGEVFFAASPAITVDEGIGTYQGVYSWSSNKTVEVFTQPQGFTSTDSLGQYYLVDSSDFRESPSDEFNNDTEVEIPYEVLGSPSLDKQVTTATFFTANEGYVVEDPTDPDFYSLDPFIGYQWDWGANSSGDFDICKNFRAPYQKYFLDSDVIVDKVKIPGKGKSLTLSLGSRDDHWFKLYGYTISFTGADKE